MIEKVRGIVLGMYRYGENSAILRIFTREHGLRAYAVNTLQAKKSKAAYYQVLSILEIIVYHDEKKEVNRIKEVSNVLIYKTLHSEQEKISVGVFLCEMLGKLLREGHKDEILFDFVESALVYFDDCADNFANFHLIFLFRLMRYLGFGTTERTIFYRASGQQNWHDLALNELTEFALRGDFEEHYPANRQTRRQLLELCLNYFSTHLENFSRPKTLDVYAFLFAD